MQNQLKIARVTMNLTQQQLAEKVGVTRQTISLIEKGKYNPTLKLCLSICHAVNKTLDEVFWIEKEEWKNAEN
ncbi:helix-turn-helix transcriptional regulator [Gracilibacillus sp. S3-1-1]|uniref:Helix-turn-helix transcriptional regulator n=1 Tax=Gracilibacillus pellucidus TaxID=3095368 RepID=A0ACC6M8N2_9BACI|nr:helix-turn-helix transcriptional regulator [Gracilibacillus sp. S3-1-1]MDX8047329.1 helix-turn-helix transcriptional regulator [Gracilibacillus sp. S3-1-1]